MGARPDCLAAWAGRMFPGAYSSFGEEEEEVRDQPRGPVCRAGGAGEGVAASGTLEGRLEEVVRAWMTS